MKTTVNLTAFAILTAFVMAITLPAFARPGANGGGRGKMMEMMKDLNLTADQQKKLKEANEATHAALKQKREAMKSAREDLHNTLKGTASDDVAKQKFEALQKVQEDFARARFEHVLAVRSILTPEQREKFHAKMKDKWQKRMHDDEEGDD